MFIFEKLEVYKKSLDYNELLLEFIKNNNIDRILKDQLYRASTSITLNIAEGSGRFTQKDKNNFYINARGSIHECVAVFQILKRGNIINDPDYKKYYDLLEELGKMLSGLIKAFST